MHDKQQHGSVNRRPLCTREMSELLSCRIISCSSFFVGALSMISLSTMVSWIPPIPAIDHPSITKGNRRSYTSYTVQAFLFFFMKNLTSSDQRSIDGVSTRNIGCRYLVGSWKNTMTQLFLLAEAGKTVFPTSEARTVLFCKQLLFWPREITMPVEVKTLSGHTFQLDCSDGDSVSANSC